MGIACSLLAAIAYGLSDFLAGVSSRKYTVLGLVTSAYPVSILFVALTVPFVDGTATPVSLLYGAASGLTLGIAVWTFYSALAQGPISIVSVSTSLLSAGIPVVYGLLSGDQVSLLGKLGLAIGLGSGVILGLQHADASLNKPTPINLKVAILMVCAGFAFAGSYIVTHHIPAQSGMLPILMARVAGFIFFLCFRREKLLILTNHPRKLSALYAVGALDAIANIAMYVALQHAALSVATVIISAYPIFTIAPAFLFLKETISRLQIMGVAMALLAIVLLAV